MEFVQMSMIYGTEELAHELGALTAGLPTLIALRGTVRASALRASVLSPTRRAITACRTSSSIM